jgi:uncharacterized protein (TIGR02466 family)
MKSLDLFPIIWKDNYTFDWNKLESKVMNLINESDTSSLLEVGGKTTVGLNYFEDKRPHKWEEFQDYFEWLQPRVENIWSRWGLIPQRKFITGSWFNLHNKGDYTKEHHHHSTHIVVSTYLQCPENSGCIQFKNPYEMQKLSEPVATPDEGLWTDCEIKTNDVLIFPGWIRHRTLPSCSNYPRIVFTMNISGTYE